MTDVYDEKMVVTLEDTGDDTGDVFVPIPDEILEKLGWNEDTELSISVDGTGAITIAAVEY